MTCAMLYHSGLKCMIAVVSIMYTQWRAQQDMSSSADHLQLDSEICTSSMEHIVLPTCTGNSSSNKQKNKATSARCNNIIADTGVI